MSQKKRQLDESKGELYEIEEAIQLASQAEQAERLEDVDYQRFEELLRQLQILRQLKLESETRLNKIPIIKANQDLKNPRECMEKALQLGLKNEELSQINMICQQALDVAQMSFGLQNAKSITNYEIRCEDEILRDSQEFIKVCMENLDSTKRLRSMDNELNELQSTIRTLQADITELKKNPELAAGSKSERIEKLEAAIDKSSGRYDFTRFLTQLLLMASEEDLNGPKIADLFLKCGQSVDD